MKWLEQLYYGFFRILQSTASRRGPLTLNIVASTSHINQRK